jgi:hypothetical protein
MSKLVVTSIGPASSVQDAGRPRSQRYGLVPSGAMDRLALAKGTAITRTIAADALDRRRVARGEAQHEPERDQDDE